MVFTSPFSELVRILATDNPDMMAFCCQSFHKSIFGVVELLSFYITSPGPMNQTQAAIAMDLLRAVNDGSFDVFFPLHLQMVSCSFSLT